MREMEEYEKDMIQRVEDGSDEDSRRGDEDS